MIAKTLHIVWIGPHDPPTLLIDSWREKHTADDGWEFVLHRDHTGWINQAKIDRMHEWNGKADLVRWEILARYGGIVVDADSECLKQLDERFLEPDAWACYENETARPGMIGCGALGGIKGSEFFTAVMKAAGEADASQQAWKVVGPALITQVAATMPDKLKVFPARMFNPKHFSGTAAPGDAPIFADQKWGGTKGYGPLRKLPCWCPICRTTALNPPWG